MPTRDQKRAQAAFQSVKAYLPRSEKEQAEYKSLVLGLPALIHDCGLCQTVAFLQAKGSGQHLGVLGDLCRMLLGEGEDQGHDRLGNVVRSAELPRYQQLSMDALHSAEYLKRYAEAFLGAEEKKL